MGSLRFGQFLFLFLLSYVNEITLRGKGLNRKENKMRKWDVIPQKFLKIKRNKQKKKRSKIRKEGKYI